MVSTDNKLEVGVNILLNHTSGLLDELGKINTGIYATRTLALIYTILHQYEYALRAIVDNKNAENELLSDDRATGQPENRSMPNVLGSTIAPKT